MMKNKKKVQAQARQERKEKLKTDKNTFLLRNKSRKIETPTILIVCEGENTETSYFEQFKLTSTTIIGKGYNTLSLVKQAEELSKEKDYDQVWCVFDKDDFVDFDNAIQKAKALGFEVACSNQAFEYWLILHFEDHQGGQMNRKDYYKKINKYLKKYKIKYDKDKKEISPEFFAILMKTRELAIKRAKKLHENNQNKESSSTVFKLVEEIEKHI